MPLGHLFVLPEALDKVTAWLLNSIVIEGVFVWKFADGHDETLGGVGFAAKNKVLADRVWPADALGAVSTWISCICNALAWVKAERAVEATVRVAENQVFGAVDVGGLPSYGDSWEGDGARLPVPPVYGTGCNKWKASKIISH